MIKIILISMHNGILSVDCISEELYYFRVEISNYMKTF